MKRYIYHPIKWDWGISIPVMRMDGVGFFKFYMYDDIPNVGCVEHLSVLESHRHRGIATEMMKIHESMCIKYGAHESVLWVYERSWQREWYEELGYEEYEKHKHEKNAVWMHKYLQGV